MAQAADKPGEPGYGFFFPTFPAVNDWAREISRHALRRLVFALFLPLLSVGSYAQTTTRYVYDDNGRLRAVIAPNGEANVYEYDPAGNITAIRRNDATTLEVFDFFPREGAPGTQVTIVGSGFGGGVSAVAFNGAAAQIVSTNGQQVIVTVPNAATTGTISVTAAGKSATSALPFVLRGIMLTPPTADIYPQRNVQFTATAIAMEDKTVVWGVDGIEGGNTAVGTVSDSGLYISPFPSANQPRALFRVRATSVADPNIVGEAQVTVRNPDFFPQVFTSVISVLNGAPVNLFSTPISVLNGTANNQIAANLFAPMVSILNGTANNQIAANLFSQPVMVTKGPNVTGISPGQISQGTTRIITVTGVNLSGATAVRFVSVTNNTFVTDLTAAGISVNAAGTSLSANVTVNSGVAQGQRVLVVITPNGMSATTASGTNTIEVIP